MLKYQEDLLPYNGVTSSQIEEVQTIGWLDKDHDFKKGKVDREFIDTLKQIIVCGDSPPCQAYVNGIKGYYSCPICSQIASILIHDGSVLISSGYGMLLDEYNDEEINILGHGEVWIPNSNKKGCFFATYDLIYHYIVDHQYYPPEDFIKSVINFDINTDFIAEKEYANCERKYNPDFVSVAEMIEKEYGVFL
jgi:hypothetical protein